jgi:hypothetical protein
VRIDSSLSEGGEHGEVPGGGAKEVAGDDSGPSPAPAA